MVVGARVKLWLKGLAEPGCVEYPPEQRGRQNRATCLARRPKVELLAHGTQLTGVTIESARMTGKPKEGGSEGMEGPGSPWRKLTENGPWWRPGNAELERSQ